MTKRPEHVQQQGFIDSETNIESKADIESEVDSDNEAHSDTPQPETDAMQTPALDALFDPAATQGLIDAVNRVMPFGKYQGRLLLDVPEFYFVWFKQRGFPNGKLGQEMALIYEIKLNSLDDLVRPLIQSDT